MKRSKYLFSALCAALCACASAANDHHVQVVASLTDQELHRELFAHATVNTEADDRAKAMALYKVYLRLHPDFGKDLSESARFDLFYGSIYRDMVNHAVNNKPQGASTPAPAPKESSTPAPAPAPAPQPPSSPAPAPQPAATPASKPPATPAPQPAATPAPKPEANPAPKPAPSATTNTPKYTVASKTDPVAATEDTSFFKQFYNKDIATTIPSLQDNRRNLEAIVQSTNDKSKNDPTSQYEAPTVVIGAEGPTEVNGRYLSAEDGASLDVLFCDVRGNAIWKWTNTHANEAVQPTVSTETIVNVEQSQGLCEAPTFVQVKVTAYQSGCSRQNHPNGCDQVYHKGCGGLTVDPTSNAIVVARTGGRTLGMLSYASVGNTCQGRVVDVVTTFRGKKFNSPTYAEFSKAGHLYFTDSPFGLATSADDYEGDTLDKIATRELPFNGVYVLKQDAGQVELIDCSMDRPNKIAFSPSQDRMYITNSRKGNSYVKVFKIQSDGMASEAGVFFNFTAHPELETDAGYADGIKVDQDGNVYVVAHDAVFVFTPDGELVGALRSNQELGAIAIGGGRLFISGSFGVVAQTSGVQPAQPIARVKTTC